MLIIYALCLEKIERVIAELVILDLATNPEAVARWLLGVEPFAMRL